MKFPTAVFTSSMSLDMHFDPPGRPPTLYSFSPSSPPQLSFLSSTADLSNSPSNPSSFENTDRQLCSILLDSSNANDTKEPSILVNTNSIDVDSEATLSLEEKLRRERQRAMGTGVTSYEWGGENRILIPLNGNVYVQDGEGAVLRCIYDKDLFSVAVDGCNGNGNGNGNGSIDQDDEMGTDDNTASDKPQDDNATGVIGRDKSAIDPHLSPDGSKVAFVIAGEIYTASASCNTPNSMLRQITFDSKKNGVFHGLADFIAQEEMDRYRGFWWNNDGTGIAFQTTSESHIPEFRISHSGKETTDSSAFEDHRYPFAGMENPRVKLGFVMLGKDNDDEDDARSMWKSARFFPPPANTDEYLARVSFLPDNTIAAQWQNRKQSLLNLVRIDPMAADRSSESTILLTESDDEHWLNLHHMLKPLDSAKSHKINSDKSDTKMYFVWASERTNFMHLYLYSFDPKQDKDNDSGAQLVRHITGGSYLVESICGVDYDNDLIYFTGNYDSCLEKHLYFAPLFSGGNSVERGSPLHQNITPKRLTTNGTTNIIVLDKSCKWVVVNSSSIGSPPLVTLYSVKHKDGDEWVSLSQISTLYDSRNERKFKTVEKRLASPEIFCFKNKSHEPTASSELYAALYLPDSSKHGPGPYPLIVACYGGPHVQRVNRSWSQNIDLRAQRLRELGFAVVKCDNRGSSRRGLRFEGAIKNNMGDIEVKDQVDCVTHLVEKGIADPKRVGMYGWSYGGYMSCMSLCRAPETFSVAVAGAPVTSWDGYDTHYTERYMSTPEDNKEGYLSSSVFSHVSNMKGKLLLIHGLIDENVHFRHTARLINSLIMAGKDYDLLVFPDERHSPRKPQDRLYLERKLSDYFVNHLKNSNTFGAAVNGSAKNISKI